MRRWIWAALLACLVVVLAGCGANMANNDTGVKDTGVDTAQIDTGAVDTAQIDTGDADTGADNADAGDVNAKANMGNTDTDGAEADRNMAKAHDNGTITGAPGGGSVQMLAANVGKGDALLLCVDGWCGLVDTGKPEARGRVLSAMRFMGVDALDAVFITHTDNDHTGGLEWLSESDIPVGAWYASAMYTGVKADKHDAVQAAQARGESVAWLRRGDVVPLGNTGAALRVLAPSRLFNDKDDNNSLVMMLETAQGRVLLTGDMELPEEAVLLGEGDDLSCTVLKAPNHGDDDTLSAAFAKACGAQAAVISTDSQEKPGTPDSGVLSRLRAAGTECHVTQDAGLGLRVTLSGGQASVEYIGIDAPLAQGVRIESVVPGDDLVALSNDGPDLDLTGWYLYSDRGNEIFAFPDGCALPSGGRLVVGTQSSPEGSYQLLWDDKKVIHKSKADTLTLYDAWGRPVDARGNGN